MKKQTISNQSKTYGPKFFTEKGETFSIKAFVRHDDRCKNGHNTFSITGEINSHGREVTSGCLHDETAKHFPELAPFIKWHLCATDGPMHYVANTVYLKERDLNAARSCAVWPDATDAELTDPGLEARLLARLPALLVEFRTAVESFGFQF